MKIRSAEWAASAAAAEGFPKDGLPQIAMAGRSNAGKSSLVNALGGSKSLARVSRAPGRTRLIHFYRINRLFHLVDLPGFGYAKVGHETRRDMEALLAAYFEAARSLRGVLYLVDPRVPDSPVDKQALAWILKSGRPLLVLASKVDQLGQSDLQKALRAITLNHGLPEPPLAISSRKKTGFDALWEQMRLLVG